MAMQIKVLLKNTIFEIDFLFQDKYLFYFIINHEYNTYY